MPHPPRDPISEVAQLRPAAPISCRPTTAPVFSTSRQASIRSFSMKGSPTCTAGRFSADDSSNSADAMVAP